MENKSGLGNDFLGWVNLPFDYDKEGSERFYNLKEGFNQKNILGGLSTGFYKTKNKVHDDTKIYALILPIPERLHSLISRSQNGEDKI